MIYYAHRISDNDAQTIFEHLTNTAKKASEFAIPEWKQVAYSIGIAHDIGKYAMDFQDRLNGNPIRFSHAFCGAIEIHKLAKTANDPMLNMLLTLMEYCIAGHHTGLQDGGTTNDTLDAKTLCAALSCEKNYLERADYSAYQREISFSIPDIDAFKHYIVEKSNRDIHLFCERFAFITRYLFSCLTDADFLDTEEYYSPQTDRSVKSDFHKAAEEVTKKLESFDSVTKLQKARSIIQNQAIQSAKHSSGLSILNMPTGSGKTLCSLEIAMNKIISSDGKLSRIIYVIPYTSIIEQTAQEFEALIGQYVTVLQHHSNFCYDDPPYENTAEKLKRATENWDAPVIITTSVQFFESLYHYKSSHLRKLHNLANSVIVLDEIHTLPINQLQPCLQALGYISELLHSEILLLSATMPNYAPILSKLCPGSQINNLITDTSDFRYFDKCNYHYIGEKDFDTIAGLAACYGSCLIVVNSRASAREMYSLLSGNKFHLSTYMTPFDRSNTIERIRAALKNGDKVSVVSTSLIEAGVDLDFETVFREIAGVDNILQAGGRCNREGKKQKGDVFIFRTNKPLPRDLRQRASITSELLDTFPNLAARECIRTYYNRLFKFHDVTISENSIAKESYIDKKTGFISIPFRSYADRFKMIETETVSVVINNSDESEILLNRFRRGDRSVLRNLMQYSVSLKVHGELDKAMGSIVAEYENTGILILTDNTCYNGETGLDLDCSNDLIF